MPAPAIVPTRRLQRLLPPATLSPDGFSFLGLTAELGMSENMRRLIAPLWSHDNMGAAEFERGDVARAYKALFERSENLRWEYVNPCLELTVPEQDELKRHTIATEREVGKHDQETIRRIADTMVEVYNHSTPGFYLLAPAHSISHQRALVIEEVEQKTPSQLIEPSHMRRRAFIYKEDGVQGWLNIDHPGLIFANQCMHRDAIALFDEYATWHAEKQGRAPARPGNGYNTFNFIAYAGAAAPA